MWGIQETKEEVMGENMEEALWGGGKMMSVRGRGIIWMGINIRVSHR